MSDGSPLSLVLPVLGLAGLDALNPATIATMVILLSLGRPRAFGTVFIVATFAVYLTAGVALLAGWTVALQALVPELPASALGAGFMVAGLGLLAAAVILWSAKDAPVSPLLAFLSSGSSLWAIAALAVVSTLSDLPTAFPYLAAIALLGNESLHGAKVGALLLAYNVIYVAPAAMLLAFRLANNDRFAPVSAFVQKAMAWSARHLLPPVCVLGGLWCLWRGMTMLA